MTLANPDFWRGKRVLVTGDLGFKGTWLCKRLVGLAAEVEGLDLKDGDDIRDEARVCWLVDRCCPEIVFHLAAQALVGLAVGQPLETFSTNVIGAAILLDQFINNDPEAVVIITSDKVYQDTGEPKAYVESDPLGGSDPYSASKVGQEIVAKSYRETYGLPIVTARAGNVIGGGDFAEGRLIPDAWRAIKSGKPLVLRHPDSIRPWTYVEDVIEGYILYAEAVAAKREGLPTSLNFGPKSPPVTALEAARTFYEALAEPFCWEADPNPPEERPALLLDSTLARQTLGWAEEFPGKLGIHLAASWYVENGR